MGAVCSPLCGDATKDEALNCSASKRGEAVNQFKRAVKDAGLSTICNRIQKGMGASDVSALMVPRDELQQIIVGLDDEYYEGQTAKIEKLFDICDHCMEIMYGDTE